MKLILFRHGIAVERQEWTGKDQDRPLTGKGIKNTRRAARGLLHLGMTPTHLLSSPLLRARETAEIIEHLVRPPVTIQLCDELMPGGSRRALFAMLTALPAASVVVCVGHEPDLSITAGSLLAGKPCAGLSLKKAGACLIDLAPPIRPSHGRLHWWLTSAQLRSWA